MTPNPAARLPRISFSPSVSQPCASPVPVQGSGRGEQTDPPESGPIPSFKPHPRKPWEPVDVRMDNFLAGDTFELLCRRAVQFTSLLPITPPPTTFTSLDSTVLHIWYQVLLVEFIDCFMRKLRKQGCFPTILVDNKTPSGIKYKERQEDEDAFNEEATAHINAILRSFNVDFQHRPFGSAAGLAVDLQQPHAGVATLALLEATSRATYAPRMNWRVGKPLASEYKRRLRAFDMGICGLLNRFEGTRWALSKPEGLHRGVAAYKEFYIRHLREDILNYQAEQRAR